MDQLIDEQANETPTRIAITIGNKMLTYQELQMQANQVTQRLLQKELKKQERVSIFMHRGIDAIVSMIGVLKAGGTYVPIDPEFSVHRIRFILQDSRSTYIIAHQYKNLLPIVSNQSILIFEKIRKNIVKTYTKGKYNTRDAAYIIYTSGSTGNPKGVLISHQSIIPFIHSLQKSYVFQEQQVHLQFASFIFDASAWEIYGSLLTGGRLHLSSGIERKSIDHFIQMIRKFNIACYLPCFFIH
ncbi:MAG: AMP-binding protein [Bacillus sp. (in: firmicutes)]